ncbi:hypothetical protein P9112_005690 [Eukaryota sp. TZLM1-RC]
MSKAHANARIQKDIMRLLMAGYRVETTDNLNTVYVYFNGPEDTCYHGYQFKIRLEFPPSYPYKSPSVGFETKIYHCNVDLSSGSICLDVLSQNWSSVFNLNHVFDTFLQQLLLYPNPSDPLNGEAARLYMKSKEDFHKKARSYADQHAFRIGKEHVKKVEANSVDFDHPAKCSNVDDFSDVSDEE